MIQRGGKAYLGLRCRVSSLFPFEKDRFLLFDLDRS